MSFQNPVDIYNRALQHCGVSRIVTVQDDEKGAAELNACYDNLRESELRRDVWTFAVRKAVLYPLNTGVTGLTLPTNQPASQVPALTISQSLPTLLFVPAPWSASAVYDFGSIVADANGVVWVSTEPANVGNTPGGVGVTTWDEYFGSLCVQPYDSTVAYFVGDLVYETDGQGHFDVYVSLDEGNAVDPVTATPWSATQTYAKNQVVVDTAGYYWSSSIDGNSNNQPGVAFAWNSATVYTTNALVIGSDKVLYQALAGSTNVNPANGANPASWLSLGYPGSWPMWDANTTYALSDIIAGTDGMLYQSMQNANTGHQPVGSTINLNVPSGNWWAPLNLVNPWFPNFNSSTSSQQWLRLDGGVKQINVNYPAGSGPSIQTETNNVFLLPNGYLRIAPQDPKAGSQSFLGAPGRRHYDDWLIENGLLVSRDATPIIFRFVAKVRVVSKFDPMFCERLAARCALAVCETLTQSGSKLKDIAGAYKKFGDDAVVVNAIEQDSNEPPEDDYILCRI